MIVVVVGFAAGVFWLDFVGASFVADVFAASMDWVCVDGFDLCGDGGGFLSRVT